MELVKSNNKFIVGCLAVTLVGTVACGDDDGDSVADTEMSSTTGAEDSTTGSTVGTTGSDETTSGDSGTEDGTSTEADASSSGDPGLDPDEENAEVTEIGPDQHALYTDIVVEAPPELVWEVLTDFAAMSSWSPGLLEIDGEFADGAEVSVFFTGPDAVLEIPHTLIVESGETYGWSDPVLGFDGITDNHRYTVGESEGGLTRMIQTDEFTGTNADITTEQLAQALLPAYVAFNQAFEAEVERRASLEEGASASRVGAIQDDRHAVYTDIVIEATPAQIWEVLTDFESMPDWSSGIQGIDGEFSDGSMVTVPFLFNGMVIPIQHTLIVVPDVLFGWSDPLVGFDGITDNHRYRIAETDGTRTRFIQTDRFSGMSKAGDTETVANTIRPSYDQFNEELKAEVEARF